MNSSPPHVCGKGFENTAFPLEGEGLEDGELRNEGEFRSRLGPVRKGNKQEGGGGAAGGAALRDEGVCAPLPAQGGCEGCCLPSRALVQSLVFSVRTGPVSSHPDLGTNVVFFQQALRPAEGKKTEKNLLTAFYL